MRTQDITSEPFVCPATQATRWEFGGGAETAMSWTNWPGNRGIANHLSYSYCNPYPAVDARKKLANAEVIAREFAVAADMNSGVAELLEISARSKPEEMKKGNSMNHRLAGQNVLYADAHVEFRETPFVGQKGDNIFTSNGAEVVGRSGEAGIIGSIGDADDSILLPTTGAIIKS